LFEIFGHKQLRFESALQSSAPNARGLEAARSIITHGREMQREGGACPPGGAMGRRRGKTVVSQGDYSCLWIPF